MKFPKAEAYRAELEQLMAFFGGKRILTAAEVAAYTGKSVAWCKKTFGIGRGRPIDTATLALALAKMQK